MSKKIGTTVFLVEYCKSHAKPGTAPPNTSGNKTNNNQTSYSSNSNKFPRTTTGAVSPTLRFALCRVTWGDIMPWPWTSASEERIQKIISGKKLPEIAGTYANWNSESQIESSANVETLKTQSLWGTSIFRDWQSQSIPFLSQKRLLAATIAGNGWNGLMVEGFEEQAGERLAFLNEIVLLCHKCRAPWPACVNAWWEWFSSRWFCRSSGRLPDFSWELEHWAKLENGNPIYPIRRDKLPGSCSEHAWKYDKTCPVTMESHWSRMFPQPVF